MFRASSAMTTKQTVQALLDQLLEDCSLEDVQCRLDVPQHALLHEFLS